MTTLAEETDQQQRWKLKPQAAGLKVFDQLLENEFQPPEKLRSWLSHALQVLVQFSVAHVPYYTELFAGLGLKADDINTPEDLEKLPILSRDTLVDSCALLRSRTLPRGERLGGITESSGTTRRPARVWQTASSNAMFGILRQRASRWYRLDPLQPRLDARARSNMPRRADGSPLPDGQFLRLPGWRWLDDYFATGPELFFNNYNPVEQQLAWLRELRPPYVMSYPDMFEEWMLAAGGQPPYDTIAALIGAGTQLTPSLRQRLQDVYHAPIHQSYGLNEVGAVACRCEAGRYHVHTEHCLVEIVDEQGHACPAGKTGRLLATALRNLAMPLIRYDTGDLAEAVEGPCPCGRVLPAFGEIVGRFRRYAGLPEGTRHRFGAIRRVIENYPAQELAFLRRFQVHQDRQNRFTLRLRVASPTPEAFRAAVMRSWESGVGQAQSPLTIVEVDEIPASASGKPLDFVSDFHNDPAAATPPPG